MSKLAETLRNLNPLVPVVPSQSPEDELAFADYCRERYPRDARFFMLIVVAFSLLWWPTDAIVYRHLPQLRGPSSQWRLLVSLIAAAGYVVVGFPFFRRNAFAMFFIGGVAGCTVMSYSIGQMGGPDRPYFHLMYVLPYIPVPLPVPLRRRVLLTIGIVASILGGFYLPFPEWRASPFVPLTLSFMVCVALVSLFFGHILHQYARSNFFQERALARSARELEDRVAARTVELRRLLDHLETAREDERTRIARELHDELGQELTAMRYALAFARERVEGESPKAARANLAELTELLARTTRTTRNLVTDLRPVILDDFGLGAAAEWLVKRTEERTGLACRLETRCDPTLLEQLPGDLSSAAFRILQESLTNVARHAAASHVEVVLEVAPEELRLSVRDDGVGMGSAPATSRGGGWGLPGMRERASALGGELRVERLVPTGTEVKCRLPSSRPAG